MSISDQARSQMILTLSIAELEARKNAEMFSTFFGDYTEQIDDFLKQANLLQEGIYSLRYES